MLVIVEHGDIELVDKAVLDLEAARCRDVLQVDAAERGGEALDRLDDLVDVLGIQADGHGVHVAESLEQRAFAFHDGHRGQRTDVAQAEHRRPVGDDGDGVRLLRVGVGERGIRRDLLARLGDARRISERQILARLDLHLGNGVKLTLPLFVQTQRFLRDIHALPPSLLASYAPLRASIQP